MTGGQNRSVAGEGLAVIAGSGMSGLRRRLGSRYGFHETVAFGDIDGVGACTVAGHGGEVLLGRTDGGRPFALVLGRRHFYEGGPMGMAPLMGWLARWGCGEVIAVSAAGSVRGSRFPGELIVIKDVIDLQYRARCIHDRRPGIVDASGDGPVSQERALRAARSQPSRTLSRRLEDAARRAGVALGRGTLACGAGPAYETPAEIRALQEMGADVATMSAAPEIQFACELGLDIAVVAAVTNSGTGIGAEAPDHGKVLEAAEAMCGALADIVAELE